ncbi:MAG TPA: HTH domain-containing protein [Candidatus Korarchaeota archaeon]|nr:HTH domain-containing protein [Candidatus Korarchaeota archaeon]
MTSRPFKELLSGLSIYQIAKRINRSPGAVRRDVERLETKRAVESFVEPEREQRGWSSIKK